MTSTPPEESAALANFPSITIAPGHVFYRVHSALHHPGYFSTAGTGRFDPPRHSRSEYDTCYLAHTAVGAFLETLGRIRPLSESLILERVITEVTPLDELRIADLTAPQVLGRYGITGDLSVSSSYELPQKWGAALHNAGFDGIHYVAQHDPAFEERSIAVFGPPGEHTLRLKSFKDSGGEALGEDLLQDVQSHFGIFVVPTSGPA